MTWIPISRRLKIEDGWSYPRYTDGIVEVQAWGIRRSENTMLFDASLGIEAFAVEIDGRLINGHPDQGRGNKIYLGDRAHIHISAMRRDSDDKHRAEFIAKRIADFLRSIEYPLLGVENKCEMILSYYPGMAIHRSTLD